MCAQDFYSILLDVCLCEPDTFLYDLLEFVLS